MGEEAPDAASSQSPPPAPAPAAADPINPDDAAAAASAADRAAALEQEVAELRRLRMEDARANEKVVGMFAAQEQAWMVEKRKLKLQIQALFDQFRRIEATKEERIAGLAREVEERSRAAASAEERAREEQGMREELERKVREAGEVRGLLEAEAREREVEMKGYRDVAEEMGEAKRRAEEEVERLREELEKARREVEEARERAEVVGSEAAGLREAAEHKDRVLSAMLRKAKLDAAERQAMAREAKACRARARQAEMEAEAERWRWGKKGGAVSSLAAPTRLEVEGSSRGDRRRGGGEGRRAGKAGAAAVHPRTLLLEYLEAETLRERECGSPEDEDDGCLVAAAFTGGGGGRWMERVPGRGGEELVMADARQLQEWVRSEVEKRASAAEKRHRSELEAFAEQMRLKDERLDSLRWQLLTAELELKRVQSHTDGLDGSLSRAREENVRLEALVAERERELKAVRDRFTLHVLGGCRRSHHQQQQEVRAVPKVRGSWRESGCREKRWEMKGGGVISVRDLLGWEQESEEAFGEEEDPGEVLSIPPEANIGRKQPGVRQREEEEGSEDDGCEKKLALNTTATCSAVVAPLPFENREVTHPVAAAQALLYQVQPQDSCEDDAIEEVDVDEEEEEEEKEVVMDPSCGRHQDNSRHHHLQGEEEEDNPTSCEISPVSEKPTTQKRHPRGAVSGDYCAANYRWKAEDLHAMGVSYKIKRLRQQVVVLDKLASGASKDSSAKKHLKGFSLLVSLLGKQVKRYQSLEEKTDDLCNRMNENEQSEGKPRGGRRRSTDGGSGSGSREELERFLEETFQLQRYVVATGQKLTEIQSRIALSSLVGSGGNGGSGEEIGERAGFRMGQFADIVRGLLRDVQRGFEIRIARIIGGIEGTLASEGIRHI